VAESWDVVVVGAGPAGSRAAAEAAAAGARVLLLERKRRVGALPHCAEFVPRALALEEEVPARARVQAVSGMESRLGGRARFMAFPGWVLDRQVFDHGLALAAASAGATVLAGAELLGREAGRLVARVEGRRREIAAGVVVAADGAAGACARAWGLAAQRLIAGVQIEAPLARELTRTLVFLDPRFAGGYGWLFPKGRSANLGLGAWGRAHPRRLLAGLAARLEEENLIRPGLLAIGGGAIPVSGPRPAPFAPGLILAGDAAGLTHPVTGAGIPQALFSGGLAGRAAAAAAGGAVGAAEDYAHELDGRYGRHLARGLAARRRLEAAWEQEEFAELMAAAWPGWGGPA
jgi:geranylgeranyl reductase family protein